MHVYIVGSALKKNKGSSAGQCFAIVWFVKQNVLQKNISQTHAAEYKKKKRSVRNRRKKKEVWKHP